VNTSAKGLRVLVTAGAAGIGLAIARTFRDAGARVFVCDVDEAALGALDKDIGRAKADVASRADVDRLFAESQKALGGLDVLVNNAGIAGPTAKVEDIAPEDWDRCIAIDLTGMFNCTRKGMPLIKAAGGGSIINLSSIAGRLGFPLRTPYAAAKWAVVGFTEALAAEAGLEHVRVNCIQPGVVAGDRVERVIEAKAKGLGVSNDEVRQRMLASVSLGVMVTAQDVANTALFLATDAGKHISGQAISVCGGVRYLV
jgi:NAD(P)-dependent dehydrogenase (short-subunit alcohol dehydrogenase family)